MKLPVLPSMRCDSNCGECCGIVGCSQQEYDRVERVVKAQGITPRRQGSTCPLYIDGQCAVYTARPTVCRLYGHVDDPAMTCPRGYNVNVPAADAKRWNRRMVRGGPLRLLHELVYSPDEILALIEQEAAA